MLVIIIVILIIFITEQVITQHKSIDKFFDIINIEPRLINLNIIHHAIKKEVLNFTHNWYPWPEKELYSEDKMWSVIPFYGFGKWSEKNVKMFPIIFNFIKNIPTIKTAGLSKLSGGTVLTPHKGWGILSNNVIRCHYGIDVPDGCYISVKNDDEPEEIRYMEEGKWLTFDDSKTHYANNTSNKDRIVLLIDVQRPDFIKTGVSDVTETKELKDFIDLY